MVWKSQISPNFSADGVCICFLLVWAWFFSYWIIIDILVSSVHIGIPYLYTLINYHDQSNYHLSPYRVIIILLLLFGMPAWGILVFWSGIKPMPPALEAQSLDYRTMREVPQYYWLYSPPYLWASADSTNCRSD